VAWCLASSGVDCFWLSSKEHRRVCRQLIVISEYFLNEIIHERKARSMSFRKRCWLAVAVIAVLSRSVAADPAEPPKSGKYWVFIGTYTGTGKDSSRGIYRCELDVRSGSLTDLQLAAEVKNPSFLAIRQDGKALYAVEEVGERGERKNEGAIHAFKLDDKTGELTKLNELTSGGSDPCHVSINGTGRFAIVANYGGGSSAVFRLKEDGSLDARTDFRQHQGKGANPRRQGAPLAHCAVFNESGSDGEYAYVVDKGLDRVFTYKLDTNTGALTPTDPPFVKLPDGCGPRHIAFARNAGKAFVCGEIDSTLITLRRSGSGGLLQRYDGTSGLPKRSDEVLPTIPRPGRNSTAEVVVHPDDSHVLVSNRGHNSLAVFKVTAETTTRAGLITGAGDRLIQTPRGFNIDPTGKWIVVASQGGGNVRVFEWADGNGKATGEFVKVDKPVDVKFVAKP
jgi:6-phosphogluconolactonase